MKTILRKRKYLFLSLLGALFVLSLLYWQYQQHVSPTRIGLINYPGFLYSKIAKSNENRFIRIDQLDPQNLPENLSGYDMLLVFGMGIELPAAEEEKLNDARREGVPIYLQQSTNPDLKLTNIEGGDLEKVEAYLMNGGAGNYRNLLRYIRREIDGKTVFAELYGVPREIPSDVLFYTDEEAIFETVDEFETYCASEKIHNEGAGKVILFTSIPGPFNTNRGHLNSLIKELGSRGLNVYPVAGFRKRLELMKQIAPALIVYMPHGRLSMGSGNSDEMLAWLTGQNVPLLCPVTVLQKHEEWLKDKQGMYGGLLSQSVTMPELDGGIAPYALFAQFEDEKGFPIFKAIPGRLEKFGDMVEKYIRLGQKPKNEKRIAIVYFKGPGKNAMVAANMEVLPSLYNVLHRMQDEGYDLTGLPGSYEAFVDTVMKKGPVLGPYAEGAFDQYLQTGSPELIPVREYEKWCSEALPGELYAAVEERYGKAPGAYMSVYQNGTDYLAVARVRFGNVVLLPQPLPGLGENTFQLVHGAKTAPPHSYIAPYLWIQNGFDADAVLHFGTHGSLEFTPGKQIALSDHDWTDPLIGTNPHFYVYTISNVGEGMIAKRRSYAVTQTYLTPPFMEAQVLSANNQLHDKLQKYDRAEGALKRQYALTVKELAVEEGIHRDLGLDSNLAQAYTDEKMARLRHYLEEIEHEKITGGLYTMGEAYSEKELNETVRMILVDVLIGKLTEIDLLNGHISANQAKTQTYINKRYRFESEEAIREVLALGNAGKVLHKLLAPGDYARAMKWKKAQEKEKQENTEASEKPKGHPGGHPKGMSKGKTDGNSGATSKEKERPESMGDNQAERFAQAVFGLEQALGTVVQYKQHLEQSPKLEIEALLNSLEGGYTPPSSGGDPIANPATLPTGRNLYSVNAEQTPSQEAWEVGKQLADDLLNDYKKKHDGNYPKKISFTLWSGSFIESEGMTIAQILYLLGVEPIWDPFNRVRDIRLVPAKELGRPRIDVVIQTSGQFRDLASSRMFLINRAINMAAEAGGGDGNYVAKGVRDAEEHLIEKGYSPKQARELSTQRIFGGVNGSYGTGIMGMVENSGEWDSTQAVAQTYLNNMGAGYGNEEQWGGFDEGVFEAALLHTDVVIQPRQSNTWGALSLDHVYEFMGGLNMAVKEVTGKDPDAYFNDYRNRNKPRVQGLHEAIWAESRTTLLNPRYIKEYMKGGASSAEHFAETFRNTFGWNVMKPEVVEDRLWDNLYEVYVDDRLNLGVHEFFERENPYALQEITAVMLETVRKGYWDASPEQIHKMAELHAGMVAKHEAGCSGFVCNNQKLKAYIQQQIDPQLAKQYEQEIRKVREPGTEKAKDNVVLEKETKEEQPRQQKQNQGTNLWYITGGVLMALLLIIFFVRRRRKQV